MGQSGLARDLTSALERLKEEKPLELVKDVKNPPRIDELEGTQLEAFKEYHPNKINERHKIVLALKACGWTNNEIAEHMGYSASRVSVIINDPRSRELLRGFSKPFAEMIDDVKSKLEILSAEAVDELGNLLVGAEKETVRLGAATAILDRAGYGKSSTVKHETSKLTNDQVAAMAEALMASGEALEMVEGVDYSVIRRD